ncbi:MAG: hypothetical protein RL033_6832 [Pseudomonadota bacterium]|jgi:hypothetical protein
MNAQSLLRAAQPRDAWVDSVETESKLAALETCICLSFVVLP